MVDKLRLLRHHKNLHCNQSYKSLISILNNILIKFFNVVSFSSKFPYRLHYIHERIDKSPTQFFASKMITTTANAPTIRVSTIQMTFGYVIKPISLSLSLSLIYHKSILNRIMYISTLTSIKVLCILWWHKIHLNLNISRVYMWHIWNEKQKPSRQPTNKLTSKV